MFRQSGIRSKLRSPKATRIRGNYGSKLFFGFKSSFRLLIDYQMTEREEKSFSLD